MRIRNGIVTTLHEYSADSEFTDLLKGRYITNVIDNNVIVLDNDMHLHIQIDASHTLIRYTRRISLQSPLMPIKTFMWKHMWIVTYAEHNFRILRKHFNHERLRTHHV